MSRFALRAGTEVTAVTKRAAGERPHGRYVMFWVLWVVAGVLTVGLFVAGVPAELALLRVACPTPVCTTGQLPVDGLRSLTDLGLSASFYAWFTTFMDLVFGVCYGGIAALIFARRPDDRLAVFASLALLLFGTATFGFTLPALAASHPTLAAPVSWLHFLGAACFGLFLTFSRTAGSCPAGPAGSPPCGSAGSWPSTSCRVGPPTPEPGSSSPSR